MSLETHESAEDSSDPAVARAERRLRLLEELTDIGMELARALRPGGATDDAGEDVAAPRRAPAELYGSVSRAIRLTIALEAKTDQALAALKDALPAARERRREEAERLALAADVRRGNARLDQVNQCLFRLIEAEAETPDQFDDLHEALDQRLDEDDAYFELETRPLRETVERLCHDLCLHPDWSAWTGEGWREEAGRPPRPRFSPFATPSPRPLALDDPPVHDLE